MNAVLEALRAGKRQIETITILESARPDRLKACWTWRARKACRFIVYRVSISIVRLAKRDIKASWHESPPRIMQMRMSCWTGSKARSERADPPLALGFDGIEDPRNMGSILRTAECAGVHGVFIAERRAVGLTGVVAKVAAGALEYVPVARVTNLVRLIEQLKERNIWVVGAAAEAKQLYTDWDWTLPAAIFLGSEGHGLHRLVREHCDTSGSYSGGRKIGFVECFSCRRSFSLRSEAPAKFKL